jgi:prepilin peptidase CpaA
MSAGSLDPPRLFLGLYVLLFVLCAAYDVVSLKIPNVLVAILVLLFGISAFHDPGRISILVHLVVAVLALSVGALVFRFGYVGAGDAKLLTAAALWVGGDLMGVYLLVLGIAGFVASLLFLILRLAVKHLPSGTGSHLAGGRYFPKSLIVGADIPYGVPMAVAAIWVSPRLPIFE